MKTVETSESIPSLLAHSELASEQSDDLENQVIPLDNSDSQPSRFNFLKSMLEACRDKGNTLVLSEKFNTKPEHDLDLLDLLEIVDQLNAAFIFNEEPILTLSLEMAVSYIEKMVNVQGLKFTKEQQSRLLIVIDLLALKFLMDCTTMNFNFLLLPEEARAEFLTKIFSEEYRAKKAIIPFFRSLEFELIFDANCPFIECGRNFDTWISGKEKDEAYAKWLDKHLKQRSQTPTEIGPHAELLTQQGVFKASTRQKRRSDERFVERVKRPSCISSSL